MKVIVKNKKIIIIRRFLKSWNFSAVERIVLIDIIRDFAMMKTSIDVVQTLALEVTRPFI